MMARPNGIELGQSIVARAQAVNQPCMLTKDEIEIVEAADR
jgi:hypothetical protein